MIIIICFLNLHKFYPNDRNTTHYIQTQGGIVAVSMFIWEQKHSQNSRKQERGNRHMLNYKEAEKRRR